MAPVILLAAVLVWSLTFSSAASLRIAWLVPGSRSTCRINVDTSIAAVRLALKSVANTSINSGGKTVGIKYFETDCDAKSAMISMLQQSAYDPDVIVGPPCYEAMKTVGRLASFANLPVFGWYNPSTDFEDARVYSTLIKMSPSVRILATSLKHIMHQNAWSKFTMIYEKTELGAHIRQGVEDEVSTATDLRLLGAFSVSNQTTSVKLYKTLRNVKRRATVIALACSGNLVRRILLAAHKAGMTHDQFVFVHLDYQILYKQTDFTMNMLFELSPGARTNEFITFKSTFDIVFAYRKLYHPMSHSDFTRRKPNFKATMQRLFEVYTGTELRRDVLSDKAWRRGDADDVDARRAYQALIHVIIDPMYDGGTSSGSVRRTTPRSMYAEFSQLASADARPLDPEWQLPKHSPQSDWTPDVHSMYLYDSIMVWSVLTEVLNKTGLGHRNGRAMARLAQSFKSQGITGSIEFNTNTERLGTTYVLRMNQRGRFKPVQVLQFNKAGIPDVMNLSTTPKPTTSSTTTPKPTTSTTTTPKPTTSTTTTPKPTTSSTTTLKPTTSSTSTTTTTPKPTTTTTTTPKPTTSTTTTVRPPVTTTTTFRPTTYSTKSTTLPFPTTTPLSSTTTTQASTPSTSATKPTSPVWTRRDQRKRNRLIILRKGETRDRVTRRVQYSDPDVDNLAEFRSMLQRLIQMRQSKGKTSSPSVKRQRDDEVYSRPKPTATKEVIGHTAATYSKPRLEKNREYHKTHPHTDKPSFGTIDPVSQQLFNQRNDLSRGIRAGQVLSKKKVNTSELHGITTTSIIKTGSVYKHRLTDTENKPPEIQPAHRHIFEQSDKSRKYIKPTKRTRQGQHGSVHVGLGKSHEENNISTQSKTSPVDEIQLPSQLPRASLWNPNEKTLETASPYGSNLFPTDVLGISEVPALSEFRTTNEHSFMTNYGIRETNNNEVVPGSASRTTNMMPKALEVEQSLMTNHGVRNPKEIQDSAAYNINKFQRRVKQTGDPANFDKSPSKLNEASFTKSRSTSIITTLSPTTAKTETITPGTRKPLPKSQDEPKPDAVNLIMQKLMKLEAFIKETSQKKAIHQTTASGVHEHVSRRRRLNERTKSTTLLEQLEPQKTVRTHQSERHMPNVELQNGIVWGSALWSKKPNKSVHVDEVASNRPNLKRTLVKPLHRQDQPNQIIINTSDAPTMQQEQIMDIVTAPTSEIQTDTGTIHSQDNMSLRQQRGPIRQNINKHIVVVNANRGKLVILPRNSNENRLPQKRSRNMPVSVNANNVATTRVSKYTVKHKLKLTSEPPVMNVGIQHGHIISRAPIQEPNRNKPEAPLSGNIQSIVSRNASNLLVEKLSANVVERVTNEITKEILAASLNDQKDNKYAIHIVSDWIPSKIEEEPPQLKMTLHINKTQNTNNPNHARKLNKMIQLDMRNVSKVLTNTVATKRPVYAFAQNDIKRVNRVSNVPKATREEDSDQYAHSSNKQTSVHQQVKKSNLPTIVHQQAITSNQQTIVHQQAITPDQQTSVDQQAGRSDQYSIVNRHAKISDQQTSVGQQVNKADQQTLVDQNASISNQQTSANEQTVQSKKKGSGLKISLASLMSSWGAKAPQSKHGMPRMPTMPSGRGMPSMTQMAMMMPPPGYGRQQQQEAGEAEESGGSQQRSYGHPGMYRQPPPMYHPPYPQRPPYPQQQSYPPPPQYQHRPAYPQYPPRPHMPPAGHRPPVYQPPPGYRAPPWPPGGGGYPPPYAMPHMHRGPPSWPARPSRISRMVD